MNDDALDGFQQREFHEILPLEESPRGRLCGDHQEGVAGIGIDQPVQQAGLGKGHVTLARAGSVILRIAVSGCVGVCIVSAKVTVQFAPSA